MLALKDIPGVAPVLGGTQLAQSPLWNQPVDRIHPSQLMAFRTKLAMSGQKSQADAAIDYALRQVAQQVGNVSMLDYFEPNESFITTDALVRGFEQMQRPMPAAILFGLEMQMLPDEVVTLTWDKAKKLKLTSYARHILKSQPIHIVAKYVFWQQRDEKVMPLFGMEQEVFDAFGKVWGELQHAYNRMAVTVQ